MKTKTLSREQVVELMKARQGQRSNREFAAELGVTPSLLCMIYSSPAKANPGPKILRQFGITRQRQSTTVITFVLEGRR